jgi:hypothetical protein
VSNLTKTPARMYEIEDLLRLDATDFENLDSRVTSGNGRPRMGDRVVITDKVTGQDVSVALNDFEVAVLLVRIDRMFPRAQCKAHGRWYELNRTCTCAAVFSSRLLAHRAAALANSVVSRSQDLTVLVTEVRHEFGLEQGWTAEEQAELDRQERARSRWVAAELKRLRA